MRLSVGGIDAASDGAERNLAEELGRMEGEVAVSLP
jgi:hypothetical protein